VTDLTTPPQDTLSADALVDSGAVPVEVDPQAMLRQLQELQAQVEQMRAEQRAASGLPANPVASAVRDLKEHIAARVTAAIPTRVEELKSLVSEVNDLSDNPSASDLEFLHSVFDEVGDFEGKTYCKQQVTALRKMVKA
jgi:hypothetical protein